MTGAGRARILSIGREVAVIVLFVVAATAMTWPLLPQVRSHTVDLGVDDTLLYTRYARCFCDWVLGRAPGYLSFDIFFPSLLSGATNDPGLGVAVQTLPLSVFFRDYLLKVNLVSLASFVMCAHATYLLVREISASRGAGIVAGFAFGFCFYRLRQLDHPNVLQTQWLPYALFFMHRLASAPTRRNAAVFAVFLFIALSASFNVAVYSSLVFPAVGIWLVLTVRERRLRLIRWLAAACATVAVPLYFVYRPFLILRDVGSPLREAWEIKQFSSSLESFKATPNDLFSLGAHPNHLAPESVMFLGYSVLLLTAVGVFGLFPISKRPAIAPKRAWLLLPFGLGRAAFLFAVVLLISFFATYEKTARIFLGLGVAGMCGISLAKRTFHPTRESVSPAPLYLSLGLFYAACCFGLEVIFKGTTLGPGIWPLMQRLPAFDQIRTPSRFFLVTSLCAAICAGLGAKVIAFAFPGKRMRFLTFALLSIGVLYELRPTRIPTRAMPTEDAAPIVYRALANLPKPGAVMELPVEWSTRERQRVFYANVFRRPTVNGISSWGMYYLNESSASSWKQTNSWDSETVAVDALRAEHVAGLRYVVMRSSWMDPKDHDIYLDGITKVGGHQIGSYGDDVLYELPDPPASRPPRLGDIDIRFEKLEFRDRSAGEVFLTLTLVNRTTENLYAPNVIQHFKIEALSAGDTIGSGNGYLAPPLFTPHQQMVVNFRMKLIPRPRPDWVEVRVTDDDAKLWATTRMRLPD